MDFDILYAINNLHNEFLDKFMVFITKLGDIGIFWITLAIILIIFKKTRKCGVLILVSMVIGVILGNGLIKNLVARQRPCWVDKSIPLLIKNPTDYSFPSGHTLTSFAAFVMIFLFNKKYGVLAGIIACLIAFSRLYLFVHFPSDVLVGAILGTIISISTYYIYQNVIEKKFKKKEVV